MGYRPAHAVSRSVRRLITVSAIGALSVLGAVVGATQAHAATLTCTNTQSAITAPYGCGGLEIASGYTGGDLALSTNGSVYYNAQLVAEPSANVSTQDFTVFPINGKTNTGPGGLGEYVAMVTPDAKIANFTITVSGTPGPNCVNNTGTYTNAVPCAGAHFTVGPQVYCVSVSQYTGFNGKSRWWAVLRDCNTNGTFIYGTSTSAGSVSGGHANQWQTWSPENGPQGLFLTNVSLHNKSNLDYDLNITGDLGAGTPLQAYPNNNPTLNEEWIINGCTPPITLLNTSYASC